VSLRGGGGSPQNTDKNAFSMAYQANWITTRSKMDFTQPAVWKSKRFIAAV